MYVTEKTKPQNLHAKRQQQIKIKKESLGHRKTQLKRSVILNDVIFFILYICLRHEMTYSNYYTKILEVNLFAFAYRLFHRDFSPLDGTY